MHCDVHLRVATNSFHIVLYCCTSFIISPLATVRKTTFLGAFLKSFQDKNLREQSLIGKLEVIGYGLLGFPGFQEIEILACHCQGGFVKALIRWLLHIRLEEHTKVFKVFLEATRDSKSHWQ